MLHQLADISGSSEFRARCANPQLPSGAPLLALADQMSGPTVEEVDDDVGACGWALSQGRELSDDEAEKVKREQVQRERVRELVDEWILKSVNSVRTAVQKLNDGSLQVPGNFCIVYSANQLRFYLLYTSDSKDAAEDAVRQAGEQAPHMPQQEAPVCADEVATRSLTPSAAEADPVAPVRTKAQIVAEQNRFFEEE